MARRIVVCVGTKKGLFVLVGGSDRRKFRIEGPHLAGSIVYNAYLDTRGKPTILAGSKSWWWGTKILRSTNLGKTFKETRTPPAFGAKDPGERTLESIWAIAPGKGKKELWCGVEPAALFRSGDLGDTWEPVKGLNEHPDRTKWQPGMGGLCLHSIVPDGDRISIAISAAGHYRSDDGGTTWHPRNQGVPAGFLPDPWPECGQCVHKIVAHPSVPGRMYMQNHGGVEEIPMSSVLRTDDHGDTWYPITKGLPSDFGFPIVAHPHDPDVAYVIPLEPTTRTCPGGKPAVYRTASGGKSWRKLARGLPAKDAYFTVLRDAMSADTMKTPGIYFGTTNGQVWASPDEGDSWHRIAGDLPPVYSVKAAVVEA